MRILALILCLPLLVQACEPARDDRGRIKRDRAVIAQFRATVPCPSTGETGGRCAGWVVDHRVPLCACAPDTVSNLQYQTIAEAREKDKRERRLCAEIRRGRDIQNSTLAR